MFVNECAESELCTSCFSCPERDHVVHRLSSGISCDDNRLTGCELFMSGQELLYVCHIRSPTVDLT